MDEKLAHIRAELPVVQEYLFLNNGSAGPLPTRVCDAMAATLQEHLHKGRIDPDYFPRQGRLRSETRSALAPIFGCSPGEIALTHHTTEGLNLITLGLNWQPGDEAITTNLEHAGVLLPLWTVRDRFQITVKVADVAGHPDEAAVLIEKMITPRTKLISLSHVAYVTGAVLPVKEICQVAHRHGVLVLVDGAQSFGAIPVDVKELGCDFYAVPGQKWLCGPEGTGALYVAQDAVSQVQLTVTGWDSVAGFNAYGGMLPKDNAERFEFGTRQPANVIGLLTAARWMTEEVGLAWAYDRIRHLGRLARETFGSLGSVQVVTPREAAGITTIQLSGISADEALAALTAEKILVRTVPWQQSLRISTGFYNTEDEIVRLAQAIGKLKTATPTKSR